MTAGLADAYSRDYNIDGEDVTIHYHYHEVNVPLENVTQGAYVVFTPLASCLPAESCGACTALDSELDCGWCSNLFKCTDGLDRFRDQFVFHECEVSGSTLQANNATGDAAWDPEGLISRPIPRSSLPARPTSVCRKPP